MKYIFYVIFLVNIVFGNDELNSYINDKNLKHSVIKDTKNKRIIIDLLSDKNRIIVFNKDKNGDYKKTFDEKLYFCEEPDTEVNIWNNTLTITCYTVSHVEEYVKDTSRVWIYYFDNKISLDSKLLHVEYLDIDIHNGIIKKKQRLTPNTDIPTLKNYKNKTFQEEYLNKSYIDFIKNFPIKYNIEEILESVKTKNPMILNINDIYTIVANIEINIQTLNQYNDIAYYLQQANANDEAIFLLEKIIEKFPNRTVAYLNLADAYAGKNDKEKAKVNYEKYINLMKQDNKESKIPQRILEFK